MTWIVAVCPQRRCQRETRLLEITDGRDVVAGDPLTGEEAEAIRVRDRDCPHCSLSLLGAKVTVEGWRG